MSVFRSKSHLGTFLIVFQNALDFVCSLELFGAFGGFLWRETSVFCGYFFTKFFAGDCERSQFFS